MTYLNPTNTLGPGRNPSVLRWGSCIVAVLVQHPSTAQTPWVVPSVPVETSNPLFRPPFPPGPLALGTNLPYLRRLVRFDGVRVDLLVQSSPTFTKEPDGSQIKLSHNLELSWYWVGVGSEVVRRVSRGKGFLDCGAGVPGSLGCPGSWTPRMVEK